MKALKLVNKQVLNTLSKAEEIRVVQKAQKITNESDSGMEGLVEAVRKQNYFCPKITVRRWDIYKLEKSKYKEGWQSLVMHPV